MEPYRDVKQTHRQTDRKERRGSREKEEEEKTEMELI